MLVSTNIFTKALVAVCAVCSIAFGSGCNAGPFAAFGGSAVVIDEKKDQPWAGLGQRSEMIAQTRWDFVRVQSEASWKLSPVRYVPVDDVVSVCERCPALAADSSAGEIVRTDTGEWNYEYPTTRVIVCLDPVVVVRLPRPIRVLWFNSGVIPGEGVQWLKTVHGSVRLSHGYSYGTSFIAPEEFEILVPSDVPERQCMMHTTNTETRQAVPWGCLVFSREGDQWEVRTEVSAP